MKTGLSVGAAAAVLWGAAGALAYPDFTPPPGHVARALISLPGDPSRWKAGIEGFDADSDGVVYIHDSALYSLEYEGGVPEVLFSYQSDVYGSFVAIRGRTVYFGESSYGSVRSVPRDGSGESRVLFRLPPPRRRGSDFALAYNYDCAFDPAGRMFVSANPDGAGNRIYCWPGSGEPFPVACPGGYSGPLDFDPEGNLYYGLYRSYPPRPESVAVWSASQVAAAVAGGPVLTVLDAGLAASGIYAPSGLSGADAAAGILVATSGGELWRESSPGRLQAFGGAAPGSLGPVAVAAPGEIAVVASDWTDYGSTVFLMDCAPLLTASTGECGLLAGGLGIPTEWVPGLQAFDYDAAGNLYAFVGARYLVKNPGFSSQTLYDFGDPWYYGSFVRVFGETVYFGESATNRVLSVPCDGSEPGRPLFTIPGGGRGIGSFPRQGFDLTGNYDCAVDGAGRMFLSANPSAATFQPGNRLYCWTVGSEAGPVPLADVGGYSGPVAVDGEGNLYYGFAAPASPQVVRFGRSRIDQALSSGVPLVASDGIAWLEESSQPCSGMAWSDRGLFYSSYQGNVCLLEEAGSDPRVVACSDDAPGTLAIAPGGTLGVLCTSYANYNSSISEIDLADPVPAAVGIYRPGVSAWWLRGTTRVFFGAAGDLPFFGAHGFGDLPAVFRPGAGLWAVRGDTRFYFGRAGDTPVPAAWAGDASAAAAIFRASAGFWNVRGISRFYFGREEDTPLPAPWTGPEVCAAVFRAASGLWRIGADRVFFGSEEDVPLRGDFDGDGKADIAIFRPRGGLWAVRGVTRLHFGRESDLPVVVDWDGDGTADPAVFRGTSGLWAVRGKTRFYFGGEGDVPLAR